MKHRNGNEFDLQKRYFRSDAFDSPEPIISFHDFHAFGIQHTQSLDIKGE